MTTGHIASRLAELCRRELFGPAGGAADGVGRPPGSWSQAADFYNAECSRLSIVARTGEDVAKLIGGAAIAPRAVP
jgi:hypothetical protein